MNDKAENTARQMQFLTPAPVLVFPQKLNVHFEVTGDLYRACIKTNKAIQERTHSEISFSPPSFQKPHLTLAMGYVEEESYLLKIVMLLEVFADSTRAAESSFTSPFAKIPQRRYIFSGAVQKEEILGLKQTLDHSIGKFLKPLDWDVVNEPPHITLGYVPRMTTSLENYLATAEALPSCRFATIVLSFAGPRGSCIGALRSFPLR